MHRVTITLEHKGQADKIMAVLGEAEVEGTLDFPFNASVESTYQYENPRSCKPAQDSE